MYCANGRLNEIKPLFDNFYDSVLFSFFDGLMGNAYSDDLENPQCAFVNTGDFFFLAGNYGNDEFAMQTAKFISEKPCAVVVPDNIGWLDSLNKHGRKMVCTDRFHTCQPEKGFDKGKLLEIRNKSEKFTKVELREIDEYYYNKALENEWSESFVCNFRNYDDFKTNGFGFVLTDGQEILSGTSTFSYCKNGVETEVATEENQRGKGYAQITSSAFILECLKRNLVPYWDARNEISLKIAEKLGFEFKEKYTAFEFEE